MSGEREFLWAIDQSAYATVDDGRGVFRVYRVLFSEHRIASSRLRLATSSYPAAVRAVNGMSGGSH